MIKIISTIAILFLLSFTSKSHGQSIGTIVYEVNGLGSPQVAFYTTGTTTGWYYATFTYEFRDGTSSGTYVGTPPMPDNLNIF